MGSDGNDFDKSRRRSIYHRAGAGDAGDALPEKEAVMKICLYARQACKWPDQGCPRDEELRPMFASAPEHALHKVWACQWTGRRLNLPSYLMYLNEEGKLREVRR